MSAMIKSDFVSETSEIRQLGGFWIVGSLEKLEKRARREGEHAPYRPTGIEVAIALCIIVSALVWVINTVQ